MIDADRGDDTPSTAGLESSRLLVLDVLTGKRSVQGEPHLLDDDRISMALGTLSLGDPGWLLRRLIDRRLDYGARMMLLTQLSGPPRAAAVSFMRAENPEHQGWHLVPVGSRLEADVDAGVRSMTVELESADGPIRERAAEQLGDLCSDADISPASFRHAAEMLLRAALQGESEPRVMESVLNALAALANVPDAERVDSVDWSPLSALLENLENTHELTLAVEALGATGHVRHKAAILRLAAHRSEQVREEVAAALRHYDRRS